MKKGKREKGKTWKNVKKNMKNIEKRSNMVKKKKVGNKGKNEKR